MKKTIIKFTAILLTLALSISLFALAACSTTESNPPTSSPENSPVSSPAGSTPVDGTLTGKYVLCSFTTAEGEDMEMELFEEALQEEGVTMADTYCFEFSADGSCSMTFDETSNAGTYTKKGNVVTVSMAGDEADLSLDGDKITWNHPDGPVLVYEKQ